MIATLALVAIWTSSWRNLPVGMPATRRRKLFPLLPREVSVAMKKSSRVARSRSPRVARRKSSRVAAEKPPPLAEPSTTVVPRPETVAVHTTHRSNRRTLNEISEGENGHGRRLRRRGQLPGRRRHLRRGPEDRQAGRAQSPGDVPRAGRAGPQLRRRGRRRLEAGGQEPREDLGQAPAARSPSRRIRRLGPQLPAPRGQGHLFLVSRRPPGPAPRGVVTGRDPHHRLGIGGTAPCVLRRARLEPVPLRALRR